MSIEIGCSKHRNYMAKRRPTYDRWHPRFCATCHELWRIRLQVEYSQVMKYFMRFRSGVRVRGTR
jgi:hypothetical protein